MKGAVRDSSAGGTPSDPPFYADSAVIAYRTPADEMPMAALHPKVTSSGGPMDGAALLDDSLKTAVTIAAPKDGGPAWLQYEFEQPYTARALSLGARGQDSGGEDSGERRRRGLRTIAICRGRRDITERRSGRLRFRR